MKMKNSIRATRAGKIAAVLVSVGDHVPHGAALGGIHRLKDSTWIFPALYNWVTALDPLQMAGSVVMIAVGCVLIYLAIAKEYEPVLLLPIGFGCILANLGMAVYNRGQLLLLSVLGRDQDRALPAADLRRRGRDDRFQPAAGPCRKWSCWAQPASLASTAR